MSVSRADVMLLEARLRSLAPRMNVKLLMLHGLHNTEHENPVCVSWGSNSFHVDRDDLADLLPLLDTEERVTPYAFLNDYFEPFLRRHAD